MERDGRPLARSTVGVGQRAAVFLFLLPASGRWRANHDKLAFWIPADISRSFQLFAAHAARYGEWWNYVAAKEESFSTRFRLYYLIVRPKAGMAKLA